MWFVGLFNLFFFHEPNLDEYIWYNNNTEKKKTKVSKYKVWKER